MDTKKIYEAVRAYQANLRVQLDDCEREMSSDRFPFKPMTDDEADRNIGTVKIVSNGVGNEDTVEVTGHLMMSYDGYDYGIIQRAPGWINDGLKKIAEEQGFSWEWADTATLRAIW